MISALTVIRSKRTLSPQRFRPTLSSSGNSFAGQRSRFLFRPDLRGQKRFRRPPQQKDPLGRDQVLQVLERIDTASVRGLRDRAIILLMATSGLRDIEVVRANGTDLQLQTDFMALFIQGKGHTEKADYVKVAQPVQNAIEAYQRARPSMGDPLPLFASLSRQNPGQRLTTRSLSRIIKGRFRDAELDSPRLTAHSLRHTAATLNLQYGGTLEETRQLLRHTSLNTTLIYAHALEKAQNRSEERIARALLGDG